MTQKELLTEARQLGARRIAELTGYEEVVVQRWFAGAVNAQLEAAVGQALRT